MRREFSKSGDWLLIREEKKWPKIGVRLWRWVGQHFKVDQGRRLCVLAGAKQAQPEEFGSLFHNLRRPILHLAGATSTRRFSARPLAVALSATGRVAPKP